MWKYRKLTVWKYDDCCHYSLVFQYLMIQRIEIHCYCFSAYLNTCLLIVIHVSSHFFFHWSTRILMDLSFHKWISSSSVIFFAHVIIELRFLRFSHHFECFTVDECNNYYSQSIFLWSSLFSMFMYRKINGHKFGRNSSLLLCFRLSRETSAYLCQFTAVNESKFN